MLEIILQRIVIGISIIVFIFISPLLNILFVSNLAQTARWRWIIRIVAVLIYMVWLALLYWSAFVWYG
jgi:hypothetical protein